MAILNFFTQFTDLFASKASVEYLLRKRYTNMKGRNKKEKAVDSPNLDTTQDADVLHKELTKEFNRGKKKQRNKLGSREQITEVVI